VDLHRNMRITVDELWMKDITVLREKIELIMHDIRY
jgi:hypothetical protein